MALSAIDLGTVTLNLSISQSVNGLPTRNSVALQDWISQSAKSAYLNSPRWEAPKLAPPLMGALLGVQAGG